MLCVMIVLRGTASRQLLPLIQCRSCSRTPRLPKLTQRINYIHTDTDTDQLHPQHLTSTMTKSKSQADPKPTPKWQSVAWQKKDQQFARIPSQWRLPQLPPPSITNYLQIPRDCGLLTKKELDITEGYDATALAKAIRERKLTCVDVTTAFCKVIRTYTALDTTDLGSEHPLRTN